MGYYPLVYHLCVIHNVNLLNLNNPVTNCFSDFLDKFWNIQRACSSPLDPIFVSDKDIVTEIGVLDSEGESDHLIFCKLGFKVSRFPDKYATLRKLKIFNHIVFYDKIFPYQGWISCTKKL